MRIRDWVRLKNYSVFQESYESVHISWIYCQGEGFLEKADFKILIKSKKKSWGFFLLGGSNCS